jgi:hypothetical protein
MNQSRVRLIWETKLYSHQEVCFGERVGMHHDAGGIADDLEDQAAEHAAKETPDAVADTQNDLCDQAQTEDCGIECISRQCREVAGMCHRERTCLQSTGVWIGC